MLVRKLKILINTLQKELILPSCVLILPFLTYVYENQNIKFTYFNRVIGNASVGNINVDARSKFIIQWMFFIIPIIFFGIWSLLSYCCDTEYKKTYQSISFISIATLIPLIYFGVQENAFWNTMYLYLLNTLFIPVVVIFLLLLPTIRVLKKFFIADRDIYIWSILAGTPAYIYLLQIESLGDVDKLKNEQITVLAFQNFFVLVALTIVLYYLGKWLRKQRRFTTFQKYYSLTLFAPLVVMFVIEYLNVLSQRSGAIFNYFGIVNGLYMSLFILPFIVTFFTRKVKNTKEQSFIFSARKYCLYIMIVFVFIAFVPQSKVIFESVATTGATKIPFSYFEEANAGNSMHGLLYYGKIPIVETFDAHMLYFQIGRILYFLVSGDKAGAILYGYSIVPLFLICYYILFEKIFGFKTAFVVCFFTGAIIQTQFIEFAGIAPLILMMNYAYKKNEISTYILLWILTAFLLVYRLDTGVALLIGSILTWLLYIGFFTKSKRVQKMKRLFVTFIGTYSVLGIIFVLLCFVKRIHPMKRIRELLSILQSNNFWGYAELSNDQVVATLLYYILPLCSVAMICFIISKRKQLQEVESRLTIITLLISFFTFYANFSRGLVRHTLVEMTLINLLGTFFLFMYIWIRVIYPEKRYTQILVIAIIPYCMNLFVSQNVISTKPIYEYVGQYVDSNREKINHPLKKGESRIDFHEDIEKVYKPLKYIFDQSLEENETFLDFSNQTSLYFLLNRENFMYVNQSPGLLSDEFTQQEFIRSVEKHKQRIPYAITTNNLVFGPIMDGLNTNYRHYLVSEYMYTHYTPVYQTNKFIIWCQRERIEQKLKRLETLDLNHSDLHGADANQTDTATIRNFNHTYNLGFIPILWGNFDKKAQEHQVQVSIVENKQVDRSIEFDVNLSGVHKQSGNYLYLELENVQAEHRVEVSMMDVETNERLNTFSMMTSVDGKQNYIIRISSDIYWYMKDKVRFQLNTEKPIELKSAAILKGDTLHEV